MKADDYEREHMILDGPVEFRDRQHARLVFATMSVLPLLLLSMVVLGLAWETIAFMAAVSAIGAAMKLASSSYRVVLTPKTLHIQIGLRTRRIPVSAIVSAVVAPHRRIDAVFGRGLRKQSLDGRVDRYRASGLHETVRIEWREGPRLRTTIIATDRAPELAEALVRARENAPREIRVLVDAHARAATEEVDALLHAGRGSLELPRLETP